MDNPIEEVGHSLTDWISATSSAVTALAVVLGVLLTWRQLNAWRTEARMRRRAEIAEELIAAVYDVDDLLRRVRSPLDSIPKEKLDDPVYPFQRRYDRLQEGSQLFERLRRAQISARTVINDGETDAAVKELFNIRFSIALAIEDLAESARIQRISSDEHDIEMRRKLFGSYGEKDALGSDQRRVLAVVDERMSRIARLEVEKTK